MAPTPLQRCTCRATQHASGAQLQQQMARAMSAVSQSALTRPALSRPHLQHSFPTSNHHRRACFESGAISLCVRGWPWASCLSILVWRPQSQVALDFHCNDIHPLFLIKVNRKWSTALPPTPLEFSPLCRTAIPQSGPLWFFISEYLLHFRDFPCVSDAPLVPMEMVHFLLLLMRAGMRLSHLYPVSGKEN